MELGALVVLRPDGALLAMNSRAQRILSPEDVRGLSEIAASGGNCTEQGCLIRWERSNGQDPWLVWFTRMSNGSPETSYCAATIYDPTSGFEVDPSVLVTLFRLTKAEVRLAEKIVAGCSPGDAAQAMGVTIHTVRTYLKRLYLKTGVKSQAALVRKLIHCARISHPQV